MFSIILNSYKKTQILYNQECHGKCNVNFKQRLEVINFLNITKGTQVQKFVEEINEISNICINMQPPEDLKGKPIVDGPNSPTQGISGHWSCFKTYIQDDWDFTRKLPSHVDYPVFQLVVML